MKKKLLYILLMAIVSVSLFGCSSKEPVTVEELLNNYVDTVQSENISYDFIMKLDGEADMSEYTGSDTTMSMSVDITAKTETNQEIAYVNMEGNISILGINIPAKTETYTFKTGKTYIYSEDTGWVYSETGEDIFSSDIIDTEEIKKINWELSSTKEGHTLTGKINMSEVSTLSDAGEMLEGIKDVPITLEFNKNKEIKRVSFDLNGLSQDGFSIKEAVVEMTNFNTNKVEISLPEEAKDAKEETSIFSDLDLMAEEETSENNLDIEVVDSFEWKDEYGIIKIDGETIDIYDLYLKDLNNEKFNGYIGTNQSDDMFDYANLYKDDYGTSVSLYNKEQQLKTLNDYKIVGVELTNYSMSNSNFEYLIDFSDTLETVIDKLGNPTYLSNSWGIYASWESKEYEITISFDDKTQQVLSIELSNNKF